MPKTKEMMRFKLLSAFLLIFIFAGIAQDFIVYISGTIKIDQGVMEYAESKANEYNSFLNISLTPKDKSTLKYNDINILTQDSIMIVPERATIFTPIVSKTNYQSVIYTILSYITLIIYILVLIYFVKIVWNFTRKSMFDKRITVWLSFMGLSFIALSVAFSIMHVIKMNIAMDSIKLTSYNINYGSAFDFSNFTLGLIVLIINEILKSAIGMKQEQELTI